MITFREDFGLYWPDYDTVPERTYAAVEKRAHHAKAVIPYVSARGTVVQAGGHVGVWPTLLSLWFDRVYTFEPDEACFVALQGNAQRRGIQAPSLLARCAALRDRPGAGWMIPGKCSSWRYTENAAEGSGPAVAAVTIDSLGLEACDAIILDVEGSELAALGGAMNTIRRFWPVIQLEEWYDNRAEYMDFMRRLGYRAVAAAGADTVYVKERQ